MGDKISRRKFLGRATGTVGGIGAVCALYPVAQSLQPSKNAMSQSIAKVDISGMQDFDLKSVPFKGKPLFVMKFPEGYDLKKWGGKAKESTNYEKIKPILKRQKNVVAIIGVCTHLGCIPIWEKHSGQGYKAPIYYCPCHGGVYTPWGDNIYGPPPRPLWLPKKQKLVGNILTVG